MLRLLLSSDVPWDGWMDDVVTQADVTAGY